MGKRYALEFGIAMLAYVAVLIASIFLLKQGVTGAARSIIALAPVVPLTFVMIAILRYVSVMDELQRRIHVEAFAFAAAVTALLGVTFGFLEVGGFPRVSSFWAFASVDVFWALSLPFIWRRYQ